MTETLEQRDAGSEREKILAQRQAFERGAEVALQQHGGLAPACPFRDHLRTIAARIYPLPKVSRPRVVQDYESPDGQLREWRVADGQLQTRCPHNSRWSEWRCAESAEQHFNSGYWLNITPSRVKLWADLLANPTELVEAE